MSVFEAMFESRTKGVHMSAINGEAAETITMGEAVAACCASGVSTSLVASALHGEREAFDLLVRLCAVDA